VIREYVVLFTYKLNTSYCFTTEHTYIFYIKCMFCSTPLFREVAEDVNIPENWKRSVTIPIFKGKGDALQCGIYRGVRLLEHGMKIFEKVLEERLKRLMVGSLDSDQGSQRQMRCLF
jgi:hypothetical protein